MGMARITEVLPGINFATNQVITTDCQSGSMNTFSQRTVKGLGQFTYGHYLDSILSSQY